MCKYFFVFIFVYVVNFFGVFRCTARNCGGVLTFADDFGLMSGYEFVGGRDKRNYILTKYYVTDSSVFGLRVNNV